MREALHSTFAVAKKEPLTDLLERVRLAFPPEASVRFLFSDGLFENTAVDRVLKEHPALQPHFAPGFSKQVSHTISAADAADWALMQAIAAGIPRKFPLNHAAFNFHIPAFGSSPDDELTPGVTVIDSWRISGRSRTLQAVTMGPVSDAAATAVLAAFGKPKKTVAIPLQRQPVSLDAAAAAQAIVADYRSSRLKDAVHRARMPHDLPPARDLAPSQWTLTPGPLKPALLAAFQPMGYAYSSGGRGSCTMQRTKGELTVQLELDTGTWNRSHVVAVFQVAGDGFQTNLPLPVAPRALESPQYPAGDEMQWRKIVENLAALVAELDRTLVPEIEQATRQSPVSPHQAP